ncbi:hypothetical protein [Brachybacterium sp. GPGPB12]|uniref:hypothetical protein n=1 Tax=Brachybacterium sp. GPGPB12 TaxID=3023517 RepID=UPI0031344C5F
MVRRGGAVPADTDEIEDAGARPVAPADDEPFTLGRSYVTALAVDPGSYVLGPVPGEVGVLRIGVGRDSSAGGSRRPPSPKGRDSSRWASPTPSRSRSPSRWGPGRRTPPIG